ncbi:glycerate kinase [Microbacterium sp. P04]|uniref:glycerate kinase n=1 Tax=Microbacterium sp. P04 TaxID=3366947 RepID=UPI00374722F3
MTGARPVVIALDSFKGSISAKDAVAALAAGWRSVRDDSIRPLPMADGGEGTLEAFATAVPSATRMPIRVVGPDDRPVEASWLLLPATPDDPAGTAVVELAGTSGIELLRPDEPLRPLDAHTRGFGEAIAAALSHGVSRLVVGIGSSASTDGGVGLLRALGARFLDAAGEEIAAGGRGLAELRSVDLSGVASLPANGVTVLTDVTNPLTGPSGAAAVFGPQKGADAHHIAALDAGLARLAEVLGIDAATPGSGAAGGAGLGLLAWGARLAPGAAAVADLIGLTDAVATASVVVTGEGSFDAQSAAGKVPGFVAGVAAATGTPVALVAGRIAPGAETSPFLATVSLTTLAGSAQEAMAEPARWLRAAGAALARRHG